MKSRWILLLNVFLILPVAGQTGSEEEMVELSAHIVTASPFVTSLEELIVPASELSGDALRRQAVSSLGATLDGQPGVHSAYFGPGSGRPVIRGFDGDRVRILNQGIDSFDVSQTSPDHGVSIEPLFADEIEVVRGPASLLYGNAAIGGVVNVIGKEIPRMRASIPFKGELEGSYGTVAEEKSAGLTLQGGQKDFAWSLGYLERSAGDLEIPGVAESVYQLESEAREESESEIEADLDEFESFGVLENSFVDTRTGYLGATWFGPSGSLGVSYSQYETDYGVPGHAHKHEGDHEGEESAEEAHEEEAVAIDLDQSRVAILGELLNPGDFFESVDLDFAYGDYRHKEIEGDEIGTVFDRDGYEMRLTGVHRSFGDLSGAIGLQIKDESFGAVGEEAFIPSNDSSQHGLFFVERLNREWGAWEFGGRIEKIDIKPVDSGLSNRSFTTANASAGLVRKLGGKSVVSSILTYAERAPNASELFAFGPHVGTRSFEIGNLDLNLESSVNLDLSYRMVAGQVTGEITVFYSDFRDYVYMRNLDEDRVGEIYGELDTEGLNVLVATPADARFYGYEIDLRYHILDNEDGSMHFDLLIDQTRATNESFDSNLPRIPTRRVGGRYEYAFGPWALGIEGRHHKAASHLAPNELPTDSYFLWGADVRYRIRSMEEKSIDLFVVGSNLGDAEARPHTSYLKNVAPLPGRNIRSGIRFSF